MKKIQEVVKWNNKDWNLLKYKILLSIICKIKDKEIMILKIHSYEFKIKYKNNQYTSKELLIFLKNETNFIRKLFDVYK